MRSCTLRVVRVGALALISSALLATSAVVGASIFARSANTKVITAASPAQRAYEMNTNLVMPRAPMAESR